MENVQKDVSMSEQRAVEEVKEMLRIAQRYNQELADLRRRLREAERGKRLTEQGLAGSRGAGGGGAQDAGIIQSRASPTSASGRRRLMNCSPCLTKWS